MNFINYNARQKDNISTLQIVQCLHSWKQQSNKILFTLCETTKTRRSPQTPMHKHSYDRNTMINHSTTHDITHMQLGRHHAISHHIHPQTLAFTISPSRKYNWIAYAVYLRRGSCITNIYIKQSNLHLNMCNNTHVHIQNFRGCMRCIVSTHAIKHIILQYHYTDSPNANTSMRWLGKAFESVQL